MEDLEEIMEDLEEIMEDMEEIMEDMEEVMEALVDLEDCGDLVEILQSLEGKEENKKTLCKM